MRLCPAGYIALVALTACGSSSAASNTPSTCGPPAAQALAASRAARVYALNGVVYGCAVGRHRSYRLGVSMRSIRDGRVGPVALAGRDAGYGLARYGVDTVSAEVIVRDLADGRQLQALPASTKVFPESLQSVAAIVLKSDGAVAWISQASSIIGRASAVLEVQRADSRGQALLASGRSIVARSLRLRGSTLTWRAGSGTLSATLR